MDVPQQFTECNIYFRLYLSGLP